MSIVEKLVFRQPSKKRISRGSACADSKKLLDQLNSFYKCSIKPRIIQAQAIRSYGASHVFPTIPYPTHVAYVRTYLSRIFYLARCAQNWRGSTKIDVGGGGGVVMVVVVMDSAATFSLLSPPISAMNPLFVFSIKDVCGGEENGLWIQQGKRSQQNGEVREGLRIFV